MLRYRLFAPGPTPVPDEVRLALAQPVLHHRTGAFEEIFAEVREGLRWLFQTDQEVLCLSGTGTAAMDAAVCNFLSRGDTALFVNGGKFGERWGEILRAYGVNAVEIQVPWGQAVAPQAVAAALAAHPQARAVYLQGCETSTGVQHPVREVAALCRKGTALCVVDGITAVGVSDVAMDRDGIDVLLSGSQKAFMLPPGLAFIAAGPRAWEAQKRSDLPRFYLDLAGEKKAASKNQSAWTSSVSLMVGLRESLRLLRAEGLGEVFARHQKMARACRAGVLAMGCRLFAPEAPADGVTAVLPPAGVDADKVVNLLRDRYNMTIAGGQDEAKGKIFRVAHMGSFDELDMLTLIGALEVVFAELGVQTSGVSAARRTLSR